MINKNTNAPSIVKGISYRFFGTFTTIVIVYVFFGKMELAVAAGFIETISKIVIFWAHERLWEKVRWGYRKVTPFNLWFTGLPLSGKTTIATRVYIELQKLEIPLEQIDSKDIRELIPDMGYSRDDRNQHICRVGHLIKTLQHNSISTIASFVSPYNESREIVKNMVHNTVIIYIKADVVTCQERDYKGVYKKAIEGTLDNFTGISDIYEEPNHPNIVIDTTCLSVEESVAIIVKYTKENFIK